MGRMLSEGRRGVKTATSRKLDWGPGHAVHDVPWTTDFFDPARDRLVREDLGQLSFGMRSFESVLEPSRDGTSSPPEVVIVQIDLMSLLARIFDGSQ